MAELDLNVNHYLDWSPEMKEVIKKVHELSPVLYSVQAIAQITGRSDATIWKALVSKPVAA